MPSGLTTVRQDAVLMAEHAVRLEKPEPREAVLDPELDPGDQRARPAGVGRAGPAQPCAAVMLTIHGMPKRSVHMPKTSPHICLSSGTDTEPPADSLSQ